MQASNEIMSPPRLALERPHTCSLGQDIDGYERGIARLTPDPTNASVKQTPDENTGRARTRPVIGRMYSFGVCLPRGELRE